MILKYISAFLVISLLTVSCRSNSPDPDSDVMDKKRGQNRDNDCDFNAKAFNAYNIWYGEQCEPRDSYPADYTNTELTVEPDNFFYISEKSYKEFNDWNERPTKVAEVKGDFLHYPKKDGRSLTVKFAAPDDTPRTHEEAALYCDGLKLRLPHFQELFDFCTAGTPKDRGYFYENRCKKQYWSASIAVSVTKSEASKYAWQFDGRICADCDKGEISGMIRTSRAGTLCVGPE